MMSYRSRQMPCVSRWRAHPGQMLIILAVAMVAMIGMLGLATDLGYLFVQKRTLQNAGDAGALAGAQQITKWDEDQGTYTNGLSIQEAVESVVAKNKVGADAPELVSCHYVNKSAQDLGECGKSKSSGPPAGASGVRVAVRETHSTFFIRIVPHGPTTASTSTEAIAQAYKAAPPVDIAGGGPFIVCGVSGDDDDTGKDKDKDNGGSNLPPILNADHSLNDAAIGHTYVVHAPQLNRCGAGDSFKGLADDNRGHTIPGMWDGNNGTRAGPTRSAVSGIGGCKNNAEDPFNCIMILPIADSGSGVGNKLYFHVVNVAAFYISSCGANCHQGTLIGTYTLGPGESGDPPQPTDPWVVGEDGFLIIRLVK